MLKEIQGISQNNPECAKVPTKDHCELERILVAQRISFSKVMIMRNGEFPKLQGAICNFPIETPGACKVLPRGSDSSGVINVELKRKISHKDPVISQQVRRQNVFGLFSE